MWDVCIAVGLFIGNPIAGALIRNAGTDFVPLQIFCGATTMAAVGILVLYLPSGASVSRKRSRLFRECILAVKDKGWIESLVSSGKNRHCIRIQNSMHTRFRFLSSVFCDPS